MENNLSALNNYLFEAIERIQEDELSGELLDEEIKRAEAVTDIAKVLVANGELALKVMKHMEEYGTERASIPAMLKG